MTGTDIAKMSREQKASILKNMMDANYPMGSRPKYTAYKILDAEFDAQAQWVWYKKMAEFAKA